MIKWYHVWGFAMLFSLGAFSLWCIFIPQAFLGYQYTRIFANAYNEALPEFIMLLTGMICLADFLRVNLFVKIKASIVEPKRYVSTVYRADKDPAIVKLKKALASSEAKIKELRTEIENELAVFVDDKSFMAGHDSAKKKVLKAIDSKIPFFQEEQAKNGLLTPKKMDGD